MAWPDPKPIKSERHHWWPKTLSKHWKDDQGLCHRLSWNGQIVRSNPVNFGSLTNAHHIKHGSEPTVWDGTIEDQFDQADNNFSSLVERVSALDSIFNPRTPELRDRLLPQLVSDRLVSALGECSLSLVLRSPRFRDDVGSRALDLQSRMGMRNPSVNDTLISLNINGRLKQFSQQIERRGKWVILFSDTTEFVFGDGFLSNYSSVAVAPLSPRFLLPLTPTVAVFFISPMRYPSRPRLLTLRVTKDEATFVNTVTQAYSRDCIFYRSERPANCALLELHEYLQFPYDQHPWLENLIAAMMKFHDPERREEEAALNRLGL